MTNCRVFSLLLLATFTAPAYAYADPNAGGLLFQLLTPFLALAAAGLAFARRQLGRAWQLLRGAVRNRIDRRSRAARREIE
jgi:cytochrome bd-type quinol oxidase subunit 2